MRCAEIFRFLDAHAVFRNWIQARCDAQADYASTNKSALYLDSQPQGLYISTQSGSILTGPCAVRAVSRMLPRADTSNFVKLWYCKDHMVLPILWLQVQGYSFHSVLSGLPRYLKAGGNSLGRRDSPK